MDYRKQLVEAWDEFVLTIGMLYTAKADKPAPTDPVELLEASRSVGAVPSDSVPLLRQAIADYSGIGWLTNGNLAYEQSRQLLLELYQVTGWAGGRMMRAALEQVGFTTWQADEVPLNWKSRPRSFFAQRGSLTLFVTPCFTRGDTAAWTTPADYWRLAGSAYETMAQAPGFAERLPVAVVVQTGAPITAPAHQFVQEGYLSAPPHHEFLVPLNRLLELSEMITNVFGQAA